MADTSREQGRREVIDILWWYWQGGTMDDVISILGAMRQGTFDFDNWQEHIDE